MNLDAQLLAQQPDTAKASDQSGRLREAQRSGGGADSDQAGNPVRPNSDALSLRETVLAEKRKAQSAEAKAENGEASATAAAPMSKALSNLLRQAWFNLISSWGVTLIWINIHLFLSYIFGEKLFCKLGKEWEDMVPGAGGAALPGIGGLPQKPPLKASNECCVLGACNLGCLLIIIALASLIAMIVGVVTNPLEAIKALLGSIWGAITGTK